jgi:hypothetical protein
VLFAKRQLPAFERVYLAIREAIATPSIERIAMAAQRREPVSYRPPSSATSDIVEHVPRRPTLASNSGQDLPRPATTATKIAFGRSPGQASGGRCSNGGKRCRPSARITLAGCGVALFLMMCPPDEQSPNILSRAVGPSGKNRPPLTQSMIALWARYAIGEQRDKEFALVDGPGSPASLRKCPHGGHAGVW